MGFEQNACLVFPATLALHAMLVSNTVVCVGCTELAACLLRLPVCKQTNKTIIHQP
jgi:hypothetical protein